MFQTELIQAIQTFSFEWLTKLLIIVDSIGTRSFISATFIIIIFGINFRKGIFIAQTALWTHLLTQQFKLLFALPRPYSVDSNIKLLDSGVPNNAPFTDMGAKGFFEKLPDEVVNYYRGVRHYGYGLPSGHCSGAMALWGSISAVFRKKAIHFIGITSIFLVAFARLYFGKHFLIDVLGGLTLGMVVIVINHFISFNKRFSGFDEEKNSYSMNPINIAYLIVIPIFILGLTKSEFAAQLLGLNIGFLSISIKQIPIDSGSILIRILRVITAIIIFFIINYLLSYIFEISYANKIRILRLFKHTTTYFLMIWGSTKILFLLGLYKNSHIRKYNFNKR